MTEHELVSLLVTPQFLWGNCAVNITHYNSHSRALRTSSLFSDALQRIAVALSKLLIKPFAVAYW